MPADLKLFVDKTCKKEIAKNNGMYNLLLSPSAGINGNLGENYIHTTYLKNVGTRAALNVTVGCTNQDTREILSVIDSSIGDIREGEVIPVRFKASVVRWTKAETQTPSIWFDYYTLPDIDETFHNPYTDKREVLS